MDMEKISVRLDGVSDIMFDRFINHSTEVRPPEQKLYLVDNNKVVLPVENIISFLFGQSPEGCAAVFEKRHRKDYMRVGQSHVFISGTYIPFTDQKEKPIFFKDFENGSFWVANIPGNTRKNNLVIKQEAKPRPVMRLPWSLSFEIMVIKNTLIDSTKLFNWFTSGGLIIALGTFRPRYGRFVVGKWES